MKLDTPVTAIKGVGPKTGEQLALAGINTVEDLITFWPRRHEDFSQLVSIADLKPGRVTIKAKAESVVSRRVKRGMVITTAVLDDGSGRVNATWFNQPYRLNQLANKTNFYFSGQFEYNYGRYQLTNPSVEVVKDLPVQTDRLLPVYRSVKGLKSQVVRSLLAELRPLMTMLPETLPPSIIKSEGLISRSEALLGMHFPSNFEDIEVARNRLAFEELFSLLLAGQLNRVANARLEGVVIPFDASAVKEFVSKLPFELTNAQRQAAWEIIQDFEKETPMNRLLQGDVGSGKTVVAGIAALGAARSGFQTAIMAPTEILARQHAKTLESLLAPFDISVGLLIGAIRPTAKKLLYEQIENGSVDIVIGTHALIQDKLSFHRLGFVTIDEQHRFGVAQRQKLLDKATRMPHLLAMTATPIPRSLQLTVFGDLDISVLNERPKNRLPIETKIVSPITIDKVYQTIDQQIASGRQVYVVCSLIDDNPNNDRKSVETEYQKLKNSVFGHRKIGLLHGRMKPDEKEQVMSDFKNRLYDILVTTTVVEVGVDVPNATVMMIENADHFGLAQLHQLRGRVGRGEHQSYCYLVMSDSKKPSQRLKEIEKSNDGFYLAEVDLALRGPGEIYGRAQHGELNLEMANIVDTKLVKRAQAAALEFMQSDEGLLQYKQLSNQVARYQRLTTLN